MKSYQCIRPCFFRGKLWEIGQTAMFEDGEWPRDKDGRIRHFELIEPLPPPPIEEPLPPTGNARVITSVDKGEVITSIDKGEVITSVDKGEVITSIDNGSGMDLSDEDRVFPRKRPLKSDKAK